MHLRQEEATQGAYGGRRVGNTDADASTACDRVPHEPDRPCPREPDSRDEAMRRRLLVALTLSVAAALAAPTAQAATRSYYFQGAGPEQAAIQVTVIYKNKQRHGRFTPRGVFYDASVPISCDPPVAPGAAAASVGPNPFVPAQPIKLRKGKFDYSYSVTTVPRASSTARAAGRFPTPRPRVVSRSIGLPTSSRPCRSVGRTRRRAGRTAPRDERLAVAR
jgi:hypothetical protein